MDKFIPEYFKVLSDNLKDLVEPELLIKSLMSGTKKMFKKTSPLGSLSDVFSEEFFRMVDVPEEDLRPRLDLFYDEIFPTLEYLTSKKEDAIEFVERSFQEGHTVVIATNPMFPLKAVEHRLRWAGLGPEKFNYSLVTAYEDFHFTKENVAYFPEILGRMGWPEDPVLMVGNDLEMDIKPAMQAGLPVFWVPDQPDNASFDNKIPVGQLVDIYPWLDAQPGENLIYSVNDLSAVKYVLYSTPAVIHGWINPKGRFDLHRVNTVEGRKILDETIINLTNLEERFLNKIYDYLASRTDVQTNLTEKFELGALVEQNEMDSPIKTFTRQRQKLLHTINEIEEGRIALLDPLEEFIHLLKEIVKNDLSVIRIAYDTCT
ncbi:HAD family hydrolase [Chloroflexota bacterium]